MEHDESSKRPDRHEVTYEAPAVIRLGSITDAAADASFGSEVK